MHLDLESNFFKVTEISSRSGYVAYQQCADIRFMESVKAPETQNYYVQKFKHASFSDAAEFGQIFKLKFLKQTQAIDKIERHVLNPRASTDVDTITETVEAVLDAVAEFGPSILKLQNLNPKKVQGEHLSALLRVSSTWKNDVLDWSSALDVAKNSLELVGADPEDILFGMI